MRWLPPPTGARKISRYSRVRPRTQSVTSIKETIIRGGLGTLYFTGAHVVLRPFVGGVGAILMLHHVRPPRPDRFSLTARSK